MNLRQVLWRAVLASFLVCAAVVSAEAPVPAPAAEASKDGPKPQASEQKNAEDPDPTAVVGTPPQFPVKSDNFDIIEDDYKNQPDINSDSGLMEIELPPISDMLVAVRASSQEHLKANVDPEATFENVMRYPERFRGHVVKISGILRNLKPVSIPNESGIINLWRGQISNNNRIISFQCIEPPAKELMLKPVDVVGIFLQRYAYLDRTAGQMLRWTPLLFVRRIEAGTPVVVTQSNPMNSPLAIISFLVVAVILGGLCYSRVKARNAGANYFTRLKAAQEGPAPLFPRPKTDPPKRVPVKQNKRTAADSAQPPSDNSAADDKRA